MPVRLAESSLLWNWETGRRRDWRPESWPLAGSLDSSTSLRMTAKPWETGRRRDWRPESWPLAGSLDSSTSLRMTAKPGAAGLLVALDRVARDFCFPSISAHFRSFCSWGCVAGGGYALTPGPSPSGRGETCLRWRSLAPLQGRHTGLPSPLALLPKGKG